MYKMIYMLYQSHVHLKIRLSSHDHIVVQILVIVVPWVEPGAYIQKFYGGGQTPFEKNSFNTRNMPPTPHFNVFTRI